VKLLQGRSGYVQNVVQKRSGGAHEKEGEKVMVEKITCTLTTERCNGEVDVCEATLTASWDGEYLDLDVENLLITIDKEELEKLLEYLFTAFVEKGGLGEVAKQKLGIKE